MLLKQLLLEDMKDSMKAKDEIRKNAIQMARAAVLQVEKDNRITLDDDGVVDVISREVKKRKDSIPEYEKAARQDIVDTLQIEIDVLMKYLPEQLSQNELEAIVKDSIAEVGASTLKDLGKVMQCVLPKVKGRADGKAINQIIKSIIG
jgi:uncharacterized protein YqeY